LNQPWTIVARFTARSRSATGSSTKIGETEVVLDGVTGFVGDGVHARLEAVENCSSTCARHA
jgi:hypothetical protein